MADFQKVVDALAVNNAEEKERDSNLNKNIAALRDSNKAAFSDFLVSTKENAGAAVEGKKEEDANDSRTSKIFKGIGAGITNLTNATKEGINKVKGSSLFSMLKGTLLAGLFFAIAAFFQSDLFPKLIDVITNKILPKLMVVYEFFKGKFSKFFDDLGTFLDDPSWTNLGTLIMDNKVALITLAALLAPGKFLKVLRLGFMAIKASTIFLGKELMKDAKGVRFGKSKGMFTKIFDFVKTKVGLIGGIATAIGTKFAAIGTALTGFFGVALAPLVAIVAAVVAVGYSVYEGFLAFKKRFEETGSVMESIKAGISTFLGTLIALPATLLQKIISFFAGLFGFDQFKEKLDSFDFAGDASRAIEKIIDYVINFFTGLPEKIGAFFTKYIGPDAEWAKNIQQSITDFFAPIINFDFSALLGDLLKKAGKIGKKIASFFGFGGGEKGEEGAKAKAETKASTADVVVQFEKERQTLQNRIDQLEARAARGFKSSSAARATKGELSLREKQLKALDKSAMAKSMGGDASTNVIAPTIKSSTNNSNSTSSTVSYVGNQDPIFTAASFAGI